MASTRPRLGIALGGGSVLGYTHIGILTALEERDIVPDCLSGTSAGAAIAAMYAFGTPLKAVQEQLKQVNWYKISSLTLHGPGLLSNKPIGQIVEEVIGDVRIEEASIPLAIIATDINTGEKVVLREGSVVEAVRASTCLPGLYIPVSINGRMLVDGGLVENVPALSVRAMGADVVVGIKLSGSLPFRPVDSFAEALVNAFSIIMDTATSLSLIQDADVVLEPDLKAYKSWDVSQLPRLFEEGLRAGAEAAPAIRAALEQASRHSKPPSARSRLNAFLRFWDRE